MALKNENGVTLIEILLSIVILTVILISIMNFFPQMGFMNKQNEDKQQAIHLTKQELIYWKEKLESGKQSIDFNDFIKTPNLGYTFLGLDPDDIITKDQSDTNDIITIKISTTKSTESDYSVLLTINTKSHLLSGPTKAYPIHIQLFKDENTQPISETYGYVFAEEDEPS